MRKRYIIGAAIAITTMATLTGCGPREEQDELMKTPKSEIVKAYRDLEMENIRLLDEVNNLEVDIANIYKEEEINPGITSLGDGSGRTLNSVKDRVKFDRELRYPNSVNIGTSGKTMITENIEIKAMDNWSTSLKGTTLELEHTNNISGSINISGIDTIIEEGTIRSEALEPWIGQMTTSNITYSDIFVTDLKYGDQATMEVLIDGETAFLRCGIVQYADSAISYIFIYGGEKDPTKEESIKAVLNSMTIYQNSVKVE